MRDVGRHRLRPRAGLARLWFVVSALWTLASLFRLHRARPQMLAWPRLAADPWLWIDLLLPPLLFALILIAIELVGSIPRTAPPGGADDHGA